MILHDTSSSSYLINNPDPLAPNDYPEPILPTANMLKSGNFRNAFFNLTFSFFIFSISSLLFLIKHIYYIEFFFYHNKFIKYFLSLKSFDGVYLNVET